MSDLTLLKTLKLPSADAPNEPRVLSDGKTVLVNAAASCDLYHVAGLETPTPTLELVYDAATNGCSLPVVVGKHWIQANAGARRVFVLDISNLKRVREVSSLQLNDAQRPHWIASDGSRVVIVNDASGENRIWMARLDASTGALTLETAFRNEGADVPGFSFDLESWPHGRTGGAVPHGTVFGR